ncbi:MULTISPECIES: response regulator transcription factor [Haloferax]|jgi:DNA-binding response OmpR family regulator|uniref:Response regulator n=5 Tax=Haloferax volcanii TaxID=2246 RepID=A0A384KXQ1_HALVD|nr:MULTISPECIES: response regulator [Haloferax]ADE04759.1 receiver box response regulator [Haloferax volcanii DS2]ELZ78748.1 response regulator [Haloferax lucentense DSM 14919]ELZ86446.1 response regulator [Haloferax alexandrinus JCM 10717]MBS8120653.1 response regulator [Haloferax volcanii]RDZ31817.1 response regulator [Haloferax sp. Atlit-48N]RDZ34580.1 response regulator [Haloferax sp. Atlit-24N]RDZ36192.1 response regulator [Haloferax sp. Atlit-47N]RLM34991.1 response regulator [Halofer
MPGTDGAADVRALIVDDEREVADAYALRLRGYCEVETAYGGEEALSVIRDSPVDIVLLDRHMPGLSGDDVLTELDERDFSGRVVMVTAVDPGVEVLDMPFDDYLCKPVDREDVRAVIDQQQRILAYETLGEFFRVEAKRAVLEAELSPERRREHEGYDETAARARRLERRTRRLLPDDSILDQFDEIEREGV